MQVLTKNQKKNSPKFSFHLNFCVPSTFGGYLSFLLTPFYFGSETFLTQNHFEPHCWPKIFWDVKFVYQIFFGPDFFLEAKHFSDPMFCSTYFLWHTKFFWSNHLFGIFFSFWLKNIYNENDFGLQIYCGPKTYFELDQNIFRAPICSTQKISAWNFIFIQYVF